MDLPYCTAGVDQKKEIRGKIIYVWEGGGGGDKNILLL